MVELNDLAGNAPAEHIILHSELSRLSFTEPTKFQTQHWPDNLDLCD